MGFYLYTNGQTQLGGYVLFASFFLMYSLVGGKLSPPRGPQP